MSNPFDKFLQQAKALPEVLKKFDAELKMMEVVGEAGAGMVKVTINGRYQIQSIFVEDEIYKEGKTIVLDLVIAAFNDAIAKIAEAVKGKTGQFSSQFGLPAHFNFQG